MAKSGTCSEEEFIRLFYELGGTELAKRLGISIRKTFQRRADIEKRIGEHIFAPPIGERRRLNFIPTQYPGRINRKLRDGVCLVGADCHYWPGAPSLMHRAFVHFCKEMKPAIVVLNGDVTDFGMISRHPRIGWDELPEVADEIEAAKERVGEIEKAAFRADKIWPLGNHDGRFETRLANIAPEYAKVHGVRLADHFPLWAPCWSLFINDDVVIKHKFKGGLHAPLNNTLWAGRTMVTGHRHAQGVYALTDYNGDRWGVDTGCIADPYHQAFVDYTEDSPKNWRAGFCVLTFVDGRLMQPELVLGWDGDTVQFRGKLVKV